MGLALIKRWEGFRDVVYLDVAGYPTIGYGHLIRPGESFPDRITEVDGEELLRVDVQEAERAVLRLICVPLTDGQFDALVSFTFNLGGGALQRSRLRMYANRYQHGLAAGEFPKWHWAGGRRERGLMRRRVAEASLYRTTPAHCS